MDMDKNNTRNIQVPRRKYDLLVVFLLPGTGIFLVLCPIHRREKRFEMTYDVD